MTTLFNNDAPANGNEPNDKPADANGAELETLRRELETLKKRVNDKDAHISTLEKENADWRKEVSTRMSLEEFFEKSSNRAASNDGNNPHERETPARVVDNKASISKEEIADIVRNTLSTEVTRAKRNQNIEDTKAQLREALGSDYVAKLTEKMEALGVGPEFIDEVAGKSPKAVLNLLGISKTEEIRQPERGYEAPQSRRSTTINETPNGVRDKAYYDSLRKSDPKKFFTPEVQLQRMKDAKNW